MGLQQCWVLSRSEQALKELECSSWQRRAVGSSTGSARSCPAQHVTVEAGHCADQLLPLLCLQTLGATASESLECGSYCSIMHNVESHSLCSPGPDACTQHAQSRFTLFPPESELCKQDIRYALFASCNVPPQLAPSFAADLELLLGPGDTAAPGDACTIVSLCPPLPLASTQGST